MVSSVTNVRTIRHGALTITDGAPSSVTLDFEGGEFSGDLKQRDYQIVHARGIIKQFFEGDDQPLTGSLAMNLTGVLSTGAAAFTDLTHLEAFWGKNDSVVSSTGIAGEPKLVSIKLAITDPDGEGVDTLTWSKCLFPSIALTEGYPTKYTVSWISRGGVAATFA